MKTDAERITELEKTVAVLVEVVCGKHEETHYADEFRERNDEVGRRALALFAQGYTLTGRWPWDR